MEHNLFGNFISLLGHATTSETMSWLESQGITMISGDGSLITSAVESGQTITLTGTSCFYSSGIYKI